MSLSQISVFLENKKGRLYSLVKILGEHNINLLAVSLSETREFGIFRAITDNNDVACKVLKEANYAVTRTELIGIRCENKPATLTNVLKVLAENDIEVEYTYAFSDGKNGTIVLKVSDIAAAESLLNNCGIKTIISE